MQIVANACANVAASSSPVSAEEPRVRVVVNGEPVGLVPTRIWHDVQDDLESLLGDSIELEEEEAPSRPPRRKNETERAAPEPSERDARESGPRTPALRALVAVPAPVLRAELMAALHAAGFEPVAVADGARGLRQLVNHRPHIVIADFELPRIAGDLFLERAREVRGRALRLAVLIGAELPQVLVPRCEAADVVLGQPFDAARVVELVRERLRDVDVETG